MSLTSNYIEKTNSWDFVRQYYELGTGKFGKIFSFQNTNYRKILSFITNYRTFKAGADGIARSEWEHNTNHGQETLKQHSVNMLKSRFFSKNRNFYYHTKKGEALSNIPEDFSESEKWLIVYLLIIDAYFEDIPSYILARSKEVNEDFLVYYMSQEKINDLLRNFIQSAKTIEEVANLFDLEYLYVDTFYRPYNGYDFLSEYLASNEREREEFHNYIKNKYEENRARRGENRYIPDCIAKKYESGGNYNKSMILDNAKMIYMSNYINHSKFDGFADFIDRAIKTYSGIEEVDEDKIHEYIFSNKEVFYLCYLNIFEPDYLDNTEEQEEMTEEEEEDLIKESNGVSIVENSAKARKISVILKRKALERADYKCELEELCGCETHYFTNKSTGNNYVELHHFIPHEFGNDFDSTIEQIENYVSLCPRCHRYVHNAVDRERLTALSYLYNKRREGLRRKGIGVDMDKIKKYYRIG